MNKMLYWRISVVLGLSMRVSGSFVIPFWSEGMPDSSLEGTLSRTFRMEVGEASPEEEATVWNIVSATSAAMKGPPGPGLKDFANRLEGSLQKVSASPDSATRSSSMGPLWDSDYREREGSEPVPAYWEAVAPATYELVFDRPFELHQIDLEAPLREIGFSDFMILVRPEASGELVAPVVVEATASRGADLDRGYRWSLRLEPGFMDALHIRFRRGTDKFPNRIFLKDIDLWGTGIDGSGENEKP